jgi:hypothetical protein
MVLGPGYEDLLLCPPLHCIRETVRLPTPGPKSAAYECQNSLTFDTTPVTTWGYVKDALENDHGVRALEGLVQRGYSSPPCEIVPSGIAPASEVCDVCHDVNFHGDIPRSLALQCRYCR